jgi:hypothetical protein
VNSHICRKWQSVWKGFLQHVTKHLFCRQSKHLHSPFTWSEKHGGLSAREWHESQHQESESYLYSYKLEKNLLHGYRFVTLEELIVKFFFFLTLDIVFQDCKTNLLQSTSCWQIVRIFHCAVHSNTNIIRKIKIKKYRLSLKNVQSLWRNGILLNF